MKNYLSGSITKDPNYIEKFELFAKLVPGTVNNPIHFKPFLGLKNWSAYMITCLRFLTKSHTVYFIPDWKTSRGAKIEYKVAKFLKKRCYQINPPPEDVKFYKVVSDGSKWAVYRRNPVTGRYVLSQMATKFQKI